jgi:hypothetical protein
MFKDREYEKETMGIGEEKERTRGERIQKG